MTFARKRTPRAVAQLHTLEAQITGLRQEADKQITSRQYNRECLIELMTAYDLLDKAGAAMRKAIILGRRK